MPVKFAERHFADRVIAGLQRGADILLHAVEAAGRYLAIRRNADEVTAGKRLFQDLGLAERLVDLKGGALPPHWDDLSTLYRLVLAKKPGLVLEYGSGCSTVVIAAALQALEKSGHSATMVSIESNPHWRDHTAGKLGPDLSRFVDLRYMLPATEISWGEVRPRRRQFIWYPGDPRPLRLGVLTLAYPELENVVPDFIYLDGPAPDDAQGYRATSGRSLPAIVTDPLKMEARLRPGCTILVDGRQPNSMFLAGNFRRMWRATPDAGQNNTVFELLPG